MGVDPPPGEDELHRPLLADHPREPLRPAAAGDDPERDLGLAELGRLRGDDQIAGERELEAAAERPAGDGGDDRRLDRRDPAPEGGGGVAHRLLEGALAQRADVGAGGERLVGAGDDDAVGLGIGVEPLELGCDLLHHLGGERVARLRAVDPDEPDALAARLDLDELRHYFPSSKGRKALIPVASRPMISFWICEVPSYRVVTRASRR